MTSIRCIAKAREHITGHQLIFVDGLDMKQVRYLRELKIFLCFCLPHLKRCVDGDMKLDSEKFFGLSLLNN